MKEYPSISSNPGGFGNREFYIYPKYDGSNIRVEWNKKNGFHKWGRRNGLLDSSNPILLRAPGIFMLEAAMLNEYLYDTYGRKDTITIFMEFFGPNSFAGYHDSKDTFQIKVFDLWIQIDNKGAFLETYEFNMLSQAIPSIMAPCIGAGNVLHTTDTVFAIGQKVKEGLFPGQTFEGVICKNDKTMLKLKSMAWREKVKSKYQNWKELM